jgi:hypothetical protein
MRSALLSLALAGGLFAAASAPASADDPPAVPPADGNPAPEAKPDDNAAPKPEEKPAPQTPEEKAKELAAFVQSLKAESSDARLAAVKAAKTRQEEALLAPLTRLLKDDDPTIRLAAVEALGARVDAAQKRKAGDALALRMKALVDKTEPDELLAVLAALHDLAQPSTMKALLDDITVHTDGAIVRARLHAVANIPTLDAIDALIEFASKGRNKGSGGQRELALDALHYATDIKLPNLDQWHIWWAANRRTFDVDAAAKHRAEADAQPTKRHKKP